MDGFFTVTILKGQRRAKDDNGVIYPIKGLEIIRDNPYKSRVVYPPKEYFFKLAATVGTRSKAYVLADCSVMLR